MRHCSHTLTLMQAPTRYIEHESNESGLPKLYSSYRAMKVVNQNHTLHIEQWKWSTKTTLFIESNDSGLPNLQQWNISLPTVMSNTHKHMTAKANHLIWFANHSLTTAYHCIVPSFVCEGLNKLSFCCGNSLDIDWGPICKIQNSKLRGLLSPLLTSCFLWCVN